MADGGLGDLVFTIGVDFASAGNAMRAFQAQATANADATARAISSPFETLGVRSTQAINAAAAGITTALNQIKQSGTASMQDVTRATQAAENQLASLRKEAGVGETGLRGLWNQATNLKGAFEQGRGGMAMFEIGLTALRSPLTAAAAAIGALILANASFVAGLKEDVSAIRAVMAVSGLGVEQADDLVDAFDLLGIESGRLSMAFFKMGSEIETGGLALTKLGISMHKANGDARDEGEAFLELRSKISQVADAHSRNAIMQDIFGRSARDMAKAFALTDEQFAKVMEKGRLYSPMTQEMFDKTKELNKSTRELSQAWTGLTNELAKTEGMTTWNRFLADTLLLLRQWIEETKKAEGVWTALGTAFSYTANLIPGVALLRLWVEQSKEAREETAKLDASMTLLLDNVNATAVGPVVEHRSPVEIANAIAGIKAIAQATAQSSQEREADARKLLAAATISENEMTQITLRGIAERRAAELKANDEELREKLRTITGATASVADITAPGGLALLDKSTAQYGQVQEILVRRNAIISASNVQRMGEEAKLIQQELADAKRVNDAWALVAKTIIDQDQVVVDTQRTISQQRVEMYGSDVDKAVAAETEKTRVAIEKLGEQLEDRREFADLAVQMELNSQERIAEIRRAAGQTVEDAQQDQANAIRDILTEGTSAVQREYQKQVDIIDAAVLNGAVAFEDGERAKVKASETTATALSAKLASNISQAAQLYAIDFTNYDSVENQKLLSSAARIDAVVAKEDALAEAAFKVNNQQLLDGARTVDQDIKNRGRLIDAQVKINVAMLAGIEARGADELEIEAQTVDGVLRARQRVIDNLTTLNTATQRIFQQNLEGFKQAALGVGDVGTAMQATFVQALTAGTDFWTNFTTLAQEAVSSAKSALSDQFFDWMSGKFSLSVDSLKKWGEALKRSVADFLSSSILNQFGSVLGNLFGFGSTGSAGMGQLGTAAGQTAIVFGNQLVPAAISAAQALGAVGSAGGVAGLTGGGAGDVIGSGSGGSVNIMDIASLLKTGGQAIWGWITGGGGAAGTVAGDVLGTGALTTVGPDILTGSSLLGEGGAFAGAADSAASSLSTVSAGLSTFSTAMAGLGAVVTVASGALALAQGRIAEGIGTLAGAAVGAIAGALVGLAFGGVGAIPGALIGAGLGGAAGGFLGGLFGDPPKSHAQRQAEELQAAVPFYQTLAENLAKAINPTELFKQLTAVGSGYTGGTAERAVTTNVTRPGDSTLYTVGDKPGTYPLATTGMLLDNPELVSLHAQLGVEQNLLLEINKALTDEVQTMLTAMRDALTPVLDFINEFVDQTTTINFTRVSELQAQFGGDSNFEDFLKNLAVYIAQVEDTTKMLGQSTAGIVADLRNQPKSFEAYQAAIGDSMKALQGFADQIGKGEKIKIEDVSAAINTRYQLELAWIAKVQDIIDEMNQSIAEQITAIKYQFMSPTEQLSTLRRGISDAMAMIAKATSPEAVQQAVANAQTLVGELVNVEQQLGFSSRTIQNESISSLTRLQTAAQARLQLFQDAARATDAQFADQLQQIMKPFGDSLSLSADRVDAMATAADSAARALNILAGLPADTARAVPRSEAGAATTVSASEQAFEKSKQIIRTSLDGLDNLIATSTLPESIRTALNTMFVEPINEALGTALTSSDSMQDVTATLKNLATQAEAVSGIVTAITSLVAGFADAKTALATSGLSTALQDALNTSMIEPIRAAAVAVANSGQPIEQIKTELESLDVALKSALATISQAGGFSTQLETLFQAVDSAQANTFLMAVKTKFLDPIKAAFDALLATPGLTAEQLQAGIDTLSTQLAPIQQAVDLYTQINAEIVAFSKNTLDALSLQRQQITANITLLDKSVSDAVARYKDFLNTGKEDLSEELGLIGQIHDAVVARYQYEQEQIAALEQQIGTTLTTFGTPFVQLATQIASANLEAGKGTGGFAALLAGLQAAASQTTSTTLALWAFSQAMNVLSAGLATVSTMANTTFDNLTTAFTAAITAATPFFTTLQEQVTTLVNAGDFEGALTALQQMQQGVQQLSNSMIQAVQQWQQTQIAAIQASAQTQIKAIQDANAAQIQSIQDTANAQIEANQAHIDALTEEQNAIQEQINATQQWANVVKSIGDYLTTLALSSAAPLNPMAQLQIAQQNYAAALGAFRTNQTPEAAQGAQTAADQLLKALQQVYARPSLQYQNAYNQIVTDLQGIMSTAAGKAGQVSLADLQASLKSVQSQIKTLQDINKGIQERAQEQVQAIQKAQQAQVEAINAGVQGQIEAINAQAKDMIDAIKEATITLLEGLAEQMAPLLGRTVDGELATLAELRTQTGQTAIMISYLQAIATAIAAAVTTPAGGGPVTGGGPGGGPIGGGGPVGGGPGGGPSGGGPVGGNNTLPAPIASNFMTVPNLVTVAQWGAQFQALSAAQQAVYGQVFSSLPALVAVQWEQVAAQLGITISRQPDTALMAQLISTFSSAPPDALSPEWLAATKNATLSQELAIRDALGTVMNSQGTSGSAMQWLQLLLNEGLPNPFSFASGLWRVNAAAIPAILHRGEMVVPSGPADRLRRSWSQPGRGADGLYGGLFAQSPPPASPAPPPAAHEGDGEGAGIGASHVTFNFHLHGVQNPEAIVRAVEERVEQSMRTGRLRRVLR